MTDNTEDRTGSVEIKNNLENNFRQVFGHRGIVEMHKVLVHFGGDRGKGVRRQSGPEVAQHAGRGDQHQALIALVQRRILQEPRQSSGKFLLRMALRFGFRRHGMASTAAPGGPVRVPALAVGNQFPRRGM